MRSGCLTNICAFIVCVQASSLHAASGAQLQDITVSPSSEGVEVVLSFSELPDYHYAPAMNPFRLVLVASAVPARSAFATARVGIVSGVTVLPAGAGQCSVLVELTGPADFRVREHGMDLRIRILPVGDPSARERFPVPDFTADAAGGIADPTIRRIAVDPGHGGIDPGASHYGINEKDIVLAVARRLVDRINREGRAHAFLTRSGDYYVPLRERPLIANQYRADLFLSLHANANENAVHRGAEVYFCSENASDAAAALVAERENRVVAAGEGGPPSSRHAVDIEEILFRFERKLYWEDSRRVSEVVLPGLVTAMVTEDRGVRSANFSVLRNAKMPALLLEIGFLSNRVEAGRLADPEVQERIVSGVYRSLTPLLP